MKVKLGLSMMLLGQFFIYTVIKMALLGGFQVWYDLDDSGLTFCYQYAKLRDYFCIAVFFFVLAKSYLWPEEKDKKLKVNVEYTSYVEVLMMIYIGNILYVYQPQFLSTYIDCFAFISVSLFAV